VSEAIYGLLPQQQFWFVCVCIYRPMYVLLQRKQVI